MGVVTFEDHPLRGRPDSGGRRQRRLGVLLAAAAVTAVVLAPSLLQKAALADGTKAADPTILICPVKLPGCPKAALDSTPTPRGVIIFG